MKKKRNKKNKPKKPATAPKPPANITPNGKRIWDMMALSGVKGNHRDYVIFVGDQLIETYNTYTFKPSGDGKAPDSKIRLVHKSKLPAILGPEQGAKFWDKRIGKRTGVGASAYALNKSKLIRTMGSK